jgi:hypothetical protein
MTSGKSIEDITRYYITQDLTGDDIQTLIGKPPIEYSQLQRMTFNQLLPDASPFQVILLQTKAANNGHWVALWADSKNINYWDSLGMGMPDSYKSYTPFDKQYPPLLANLLATDPRRRPIIANYKDYQQWSGTVSTCGRWSGLRIKLRALNNDEFDRIFEGNSGLLRNRDFVTTILTLVSLHDIRQAFGFS